jgi:hypothetical protein
MHFLFFIYLHEQPISIKHHIQCIFFIYVFEPIYAITLIIDEFTYSRIYHFLENDFLDLQ